MAKKNIITLAFALLFIPNVLGQSFDYERVKMHVDSKDCSNIPLNELVNKILVENWSSKEKAFGIYYWIANNIDYKIDAVKSANENHYLTNVENTYNQRKSNCWGYSNLLKYLCTEAGIKAETITGYLRVQEIKAGQPIIYNNDYLHAWNSILIDNNWLLLDVTLAHGNKEDVVDYYFDTKPEFFVANHYPSDMKWQLLNEKITEEVFNKLPYLSPYYFILGFPENFPKNGNLISNSNGIVKFKLTPPQGINISFQIYDFIKDEWHSAEVNTCKNLSNKFSFSLQNPGKYLLRIDAEYETQWFYITRPGVVEYTVEY